MNQWKVHADLRQGGWLRFNPDRAVVHGNNPLRNTQSEPAAFDSVRVRGISAEEAVEDVRLRVRCDARTGVRDREFRTPGIAAQCHRDVAARPIVFHGVVREVQQ